MKIDFTLEELAALNAACYTQAERVKELVRYSGELHVAVIGPEKQFNILRSAIAKIGEAIIASKESR